MIVFHDWKTISQSLRKLNVNTINSQCAKCIVRYYCGGGCRGEAYYKFKDIKAPSPYCQDSKKTILDTMFILSENFEIFKEKAQAYHYLNNRFKNPKGKDYRF